MIERIIERVVVNLASRKLAAFLRRHFKGAR